MNSQQPIYTELIRCQDCYKCVRQCPVKAIQVVNDSARVMSERCVYCGTCVNVCPVGAKKVRDDLSRAKLLLRRKPRVIASLAPSFAAEFPGVDPARLIRSLRLLGFWGVSETALGAEHVSAACASLLRGAGPGVYISTACPTVVETVRKYYPDLAPDLLRMASPLQAHCTLLREAYGEDVGVVFIGPCISKKLEADALPDRLHVALTFRELQRWFEDRGVDPGSETPLPEDAFVPRRAAEGVLYPIDGGMNQGIAARLEDAEVRYMAFSGMENLKNAMDGLAQASMGRRLFLELLACEGGCVNGPQARNCSGTALKRMQVLDYMTAPGILESDSPLDLHRPIEAAAILGPSHEAAEIQQVLARLGKIHPEDELNCGGCGYDTCRNLAAAMLEGRAESGMCVSYMRKLALNKANALIRAMPSGAVIVDDSLSIVDCNRKFAEMLGEDTLMVFDAKPGMEGADLRKVLAFQDLFARGLDPGFEPVRRDIRHGERVLRVTVFPIETGRLVGGILQDITEPAVQREEIIRQAQDVIRKNLTTVQQIAYLLGENAADTELMLNGIIDSYRLAPASESVKDKGLRHG